jgi:hypothetical protein
MPPPRELTDDYRLEKILGSSRGSSVLRATHLATGRTVAIKLINVPAPATPSLAARLGERFGAYAATLAGLRHRNLPAVLDWGLTPDGSAFLVMESLDGVGFDADSSSAGGTAPDRILPLLAQALDGLEELARHGLAHLNLCPENLLLAAPDPADPATPATPATPAIGSQPFPLPPRLPVVKLLGLGTPLFYLGQPWPEADGARFRAPELAMPAAEAAMPDWRADCFSLALTACNALGATVAIAEDAAASMRTAGRGETARPQTVRAVQMPLALSFELANDEALRQILERCLRQAPEERPTHGAIRDAFSLALGGVAPAAGALVTGAGDAPDADTAGIAFPPLEAAAGPSLGGPGDWREALSGTLPPPEPPSWHRLQAFDGPSELSAPAGGEAIPERDSLLDLFDVPATLPDLEESATAGSAGDFGLHLPEGFELEPPPLPGFDLGLPAADDPQAAVAPAAPPPVAPSAPPPGTVSPPAWVSHRVREIPIIPPATAPDSAPLAAAQPAGGGAPGTAAPGTVAAAPAGAPGIPGPMPRPSAASGVPAAAPAGPRAAVAPASSPAVPSRAQERARPAPPAPRVAPLPAAAPAAAGVEPAPSSGELLSGVDELLSSLPPPPAVMAQPGEARVGASRGVTAAGAGGAAVAGVAGAAAAARGTGAAAAARPGSAVAPAAGWDRMLVLLRGLPRPALLASAGALLLAVGVAAFVLAGHGSRQAPPGSREAAGDPAAPAPPPLAPGRSAAAKFFDATSWLILGKESDQRVRQELRELTFGDQGELGAEGCGQLGAMQQMLASAQLETAPQDLASGLRNGDLGALESVVEVASARDLPPGQLGDLERARGAVQLYRLARSAAAAGDWGGVLERFHALQGLSHTLRDPLELRDRAAQALEADAAALARDGRYDEAVARLGPVLGSWPERGAAKEQARSYGTAAADEKQQQAILDSVPGFASRRKPSEPLALLRALQPTPHLEQRIVEARQQLEAQLAQLDAQPPQVTLRPGYPLDYSRGNVVTLSFRVTDDYQVRSVKLFARPQAGRVRELPLLKSGASYYDLEIPPTFHQNGTVELWVVATDLSGHEGILGSKDNPLRLTRRKGFEQLLH